MSHKNLDVLISTSNEHIYEIKNLLLSPIENIKYKISHQIYDRKEYRLRYIRDDVILKQSKGKGLSKNRNNCISMASGEICLLADDDVRYSKEFFDNIMKAFNANSKIDIITFKIKTNPSEPEYKKYHNFPFWHNIITIFKVSSIEIVFRLKSIRDANIRFDENFGIGTKFNYGEENLFLVDALNQGLKVLYLPYYIVNHQYKRTNITNKYADDRIITLGALVYRIFGIYSFFFILSLSLLKFHEYRYYISIQKFLNLSFKGCIYAIKGLKKREKILNNFLMVFYSKVLDGKKKGYNIKSKK